MFRSLSTGRVIDPDRKTGDRSRWTQFSFPTRWHYDVLWGLDYLRRAGVEPDNRVAEAVDMVEKKRDEYGRWPLENPHAGDVHFDMEDGAGKPSRWNTLRALRVLDWYSARDDDAETERQFLIVIVIALISIIIGIFIFGLGST